MIPCHLPQDIVDSSVALYQHSLVVLVLPWSVASAEEVDYKNIFFSGLDLQLRRTGQESLSILRMPKNMLPDSGK